MYSARQTIHRIFVLSLMLSIALTDCMKIDSIAKHSQSKRSTSTDVKHQFKTLDNDADIYLNPNDGVLIGEDAQVWVSDINSGTVLWRPLEKGIMKRVLEHYKSTYPDNLVFSADANRRVEVDAVVEDLTTTQVPERTTGTIDDSRQDFATLANSPKQQKNNDDKEIVFPSILVTTDFNVPFETKNEIELYEHLIYQLAFWNAVDLKFRNATNPKVRLRIAGFFIGTTREGTSYLNQHMEDGRVNLLNAIYDMAELWTGPYEDYIVATITNLGLFSQSQDGEKNVEIGVEIGKIPLNCNDKTISELFPRIIVEDDKAFGGINSAAHEVAHALGVSHDDASSECNGYLMADTESSGFNNAIWSKCSLEQLSVMLRRSNCVDEPKTTFPSGKPLGKILPGMLKTANQQCQARGFDDACQITPDICKNLECRRTIFKLFRSRFFCYRLPSAAEGTECAAGRVCLNGECKRLYSAETLQKE